MASDGFHYKTKGTLCSVQTSVYPAAAVKVVTGTLAGASGSCMVLFFSYLECCILMSAQTSQGQGDCRVLL